MLKNYFIIAIRHLLRHKQSSILNVSCLIVGITFFLIIGDYIIQQMNVNSEIRNVENQFILKSKWKQEGMGPAKTSLGPLAKTLSEEFPGLVANYYRFDPVATTVSAGDKHFTEDISIGDTTFISMFGFSLLHGNPRQAFPSGQSAVVTETFALKYFGKTDVVNNEITVHTRSDGGKHNFIISAVLKKMSPNSVSSFIVSNTEYQVYLPIENNQYFQGGDKGDNWYNVFIVGMLELKPGITPANLVKPIEQVLLKNQPYYTRDNLTVELDALKDYHLKSNNGAIWNLIATLSLVALLTILLAVVNFINLNIGTSSYRLKEIGLRKVFGSARLQLATQFLTEALLLAVIASFFSLVLYESLIPVFSELLKTRLSPVLQFNRLEILFLLILTFTTGLLSGAYPAFVFSSMKATNSMKGKMDFSDKGAMLRKSLVVVQFAIAIIVFVSSLNISSQVSFLFAKDVGYEKDQVLVISSIPHQNDSSGISKMERIKEQLVNMQGIKSISLSNDIPDGNDGNSAQCDHHFPRQSDHPKLSQL